MNKTPPSPKDRQERGKKIEAVWNKDVCPCSCHCHSTICEWRHEPKCEHCKPKPPNPISKGECRYCKFEKVRGMQPPYFHNHYQPPQEKYYVTGIGKGETKPLKGKPPKNTVTMKFPKKDTAEWEEDLLERINEIHGCGWNGRVDCSKNSDCEELIPLIKSLLSSQRQQMLEEIEKMKHDRTFTADIEYSEGFEDCKVKVRKALQK